MPAPLQLGSCCPTDIRQRAAEILALTKMNWNSSEGIGRYPITVSFARKVGTLMTELSDNQTPNPSYRFYMYALKDNSRLVGNHEPRARPGPGLYHLPLPALARTQEVPLFAESRNRKRRRE